MATHRNLWFAPRICFAAAALCFANAEQDCSALSLLQTGISMQQGSVPSDFFEAEDKVLNMVEGENVGTPSSAASTEETHLAAARLYGLSAAPLDIGLDAVPQFADPAAKHSGFLDRLKSIGRTIAAEATTSAAPLQLAQVTAAPSPRDATDPATLKEALANDPQLASIAAQIAELRESMAAQSAAPTGSRSAQLLQDRSGGSLNSRKETEKAATAAEKADRSAELESAEKAATGKAATSPGLSWSALQAELESVREEKQRLQTNMSQASAGAADKVELASLRKENKRLKLDASQAAAKARAEVEELHAELKSEARAQAALQGQVSQAVARANVEASEEVQMSEAVEKANAEAGQLRSEVENLKVQLLQAAEKDDIKLLENDERRLLQLLDHKL